jgi:WD40 repeat protein
MGETPAVWDLATGKLRFRLPVPPGAMAQLSGDGATIVTLEPGKLRTWSVKDGTPRGEQAIPPAMMLGLRVEGASYSADVMGGAAIGTIDLTKPPIIIKGPRSGPALGVNGTKVASIVDHRLAVWDVDHPDAPRTFGAGLGDFIMAYGFSPDGTSLAVSTGGRSVQIWNLETGSAISLDGHDGYVFSLAWSPDGHKIATGSIDRTVRVWDPTNGAQLAVLYGHSDLVATVRWDGDTDRIISASTDGTVRIFDARSRAVSLALHHEGPVSLRLSGDERRLLAVGYNSVAWVYDLDKHEQIAKYDDQVPEVPSRMMRNEMFVGGDIDASGQRIVVPSGNAAKIISLADRTHAVVLGPHKAPVTCARFFSDGRVATGTEDGRLTLWTASGAVAREIAIGKERIEDIQTDARSDRVLVSTAAGVVKLVERDGTVRDVARSSDAIPGLAFAHDGTHIATAGNTVASVYDTATGALLWAAHGMSDVQAVVFSPDDRRVAVANWEGSVSVYDAADGRLLARFGDVRNSGFLFGVAYSSRGDLLTADDHGEIRIWPVAVEERAADVVAQDVSCSSPYQLVGSHLIAHIDPTCRR